MYPRASNQHSNSSTQTETVSPGTRLGCPERDANQRERGAHADTGTDQNVVQGASVTPEHKLTSTFVPTTTAIETTPRFTATPEPPDVPTLKPKRTSTPESEPTDTPNTTSLPTEDADATASASPPFEPQNLTAVVNEDGTVAGYQILRQLPRMRTPCWSMWKTRAAPTRPTPTRK